MANKIIDYRILHFEGGLWHFYPIYIINAKVFVFGTYHATYYDLNGYFLLWDHASGAATETSTYLKNDTYSFDKMLSSRTGR